MAEVLENQVIDVLMSRAKIQRSDFSREMTLDGVGLDSIDMIETVFELEDKFKIVIPFNSNTEERDGLRTAGDVIDLVARLIHGSEPVAAQ